MSANFHANVAVLLAFACYNYRQNQQSILVLTLATASPPLLQEFHEDLTAKSRDVERLTKAPSRPGARGGMHGGASTWRLNEASGEVNPRVIALQNKWRAVWRVSVDRKKHLQDLLDHLLEVKLLGGG